MKTVRVTLTPSSKPAGRIRTEKVDATTEKQITKQIKKDDAALVQEAAKFVQRVRRRLGFSQAEFASSINVSLETIRNWEQGKRTPTGAAQALLKVLDKAPEVALSVLR